MRDGRCENAHDRLDCLRDTDLADLREVNAKVAEQALYGTFAFVPVVDGDFIRESPIKALRRGKLNSVTPLHLHVAFKCSTPIATRTCRREHL